MRAEWSDGSPANWDTLTLPDYLDALAAWLENCGAHYDRRGRTVPWNGWEVLRCGLRGAVVSE
ncbi:DUF7660 family protein [Actinokineospora auranticolor]|uniref:DUF7660 family protein n=1 Tax=Actinokineospora auranticolor TaxID=155976 RepID=UPI003CCC3B1A